MSKKTNSEGSDVRCHGRRITKGVNGSWCQHFNRDRLYEGLKKLGWGRHCPFPRSKASAVKEALEEVVKEMRLKNVQVRGLKDVNRDGYVVNLEEPGMDKNDYVPLFSARWEQPSDNVESYIKTTDLHGSVSEVLVDKWFQHCKKRIRQTQVVKAMGVIVKEHLDGNAQGGGDHWIPEEFFENFEELREAIKDAAEGHVDLFAPKFAIADEEAVKLMQATIRHEIKNDAEYIKSEAQRDGVKERALRNQQQRAKQLHERITRYEKYLGEAMADLHDAADNCETAVVETSIKAFPDIFGIGQKIDEQLAKEQSAEEIAESVATNADNEITAEAVNPFAF